MLRTTVNAHLVLRVGRWEYLKAVWRCLESLEFNMISVDALVDSFAFRRRIKHPIIVWLPRDCAILALADSPLVSLWLWYFAMLPCYRFPMVYYGITMVLLYHNVSRIVWLWLASTAHWNACSTLFSRWDTAALGPAWIGSLTSWKHRDLRGMTRHDAAWLGMTRHDQQPVWIGLVYMNSVIHHASSFCHQL